MPTWYNESSFYFLKAEGGHMKRFLIIILIILVVLQVLPFLIPLSKYTYDAGLRPFENSAFYEDGSVPIHYRVYLPETSRIKGKLLFVHGLGASTASFGANAPRLAEQGYMVVSVDLPGFGYSARGTDLDHSQVNRARQLWALLNQVDLSSKLEIGVMPWHLAGHSMGGGTVAAMATSRPDRTKSLILIDGALTGGGRASESGGLLFYPPVSRWAQVILEHVVIKEKRIASILKSAYRREATEAEVKQYLDPLTVKGTARGAINFVRSSKALTLETLEGYKGAILAVWGEKDDWVPLSELDTIQKFLPQTERFVIDGAGHVPHETHVAIVNEALLKFLEARR